MMTLMFLRLLLCASVGATLLGPSSASAASDDLATYVVAGDPGASRTIVEHSDYLCPHCAAALSQLVPQVDNTPDLRLVLLPWPLTVGCNDHVAVDNGDIRCQLPIAAECAREQGRYEAVALDLYSRQALLADATDVRETVLAVGASAGLRKGRFRRCLDSASAREAVRSVASLTVLPGTPMFDVMFAKQPPVRVEGGPADAYAAATAGDAQPAPRPTEDQQ